MFPSLVEKDKDKDDLRSKYVILKNLQVHKFKSYRKNSQKRLSKLLKISSSYVILQLTRIEKVVSKPVQYSGAMLFLSTRQKVAIICRIWVH